MSKPPTGYASSLVSSPNAAVLAKVGLVGVTAAVGIWVVARRWYAEDRRKDRHVEKPARVLKSRLTSQHAGCKVTVVSTEKQWSDIEADFVGRVNRYRVVALDCEWVQSKPQKIEVPDGDGVKAAKVKPTARKVALLQLSTADAHCALVRLSQTKVVPKGLYPVLADPNIIKAGVNVLEDAAKLREDYGVAVRGCFDLRHLAAGFRPDLPRLGLAALADAFVNVKMDKDWRVSASDWEAANGLSERQIAYAANDVVVAINVLLQAASEAASNESQSKNLISRVWGDEKETKGSKDNEMDKLASIAYDLCTPKVGAKFAKKCSNQPPAEKKEKAPKQNGANAKPADSKESKKRAARSGPLYHNAFLEAPDGQALCTCDVRKAEWYVAKGLGEKVSDDPLRVRLAFEPSGRPVGEAGDYYLSVKDNQCVVCGGEESYLRKYIVPHEYRKHFPDVMRDHQSHDVLLMCLPCHQRSNLHDYSLRRTLEAECDAPIGTEEDVKVSADFALRQVRSAGRALLTNRSSIPAARVAELEDVLKKHFEVDAVDEEVMRKGANVVATVPNNNYKPHGQQVVQHYLESGKGLMALEKRWRQHFLDTMKPQFLPDLWSVDHQKLRLDIRVEEKRIDLEDYAKAAGSQQCDSNDNKD